MLSRQQAILLRETSTTPLSLSLARLSEPTKVICEECIRPPGSMRNPPHQAPTRTPAAAVGPFRSVDLFSARTVAAESCLLCLANESCIVKSEPFASGGGETHPVIRFKCVTPSPSDFFFSPPSLSSGTFFSESLSLLQFL